METQIYRDVCREGASLEPLVSFCFTCKLTMWVSRLALRSEHFWFRSSRLGYLFRFAAVVWRYFRNPARNPMLSGTRQVKQRFYLRVALWSSNWWTQSQTATEIPLALITSWNCLVSHHNLIVIFGQTFVPTQSESDGRHNSPSL